MSPSSPEGARREEALASKLKQARVLNRAWAFIASGFTMYGAWYLGLRV